VSLAEITVELANDKPVNTVALTVVAKLINVLAHDQKSALVVPVIVFSLEADNPEYNEFTALSPVLVPL
jgi:hypothetical protein